MPDDGADVRGRIEKVILIENAAEKIHLEKPNGYEKKEANNL